VTHKTIMKFMQKTVTKLQAGVFLLDGQPHEVKSLSLCGS